MNGHRPPDEDGLPPSGESPPDLGRLDALLRARARELARAPAADGAGATAEVLAFRLGEETYAVELRQLAAVQPARGLTPVPCAPPHVAGLLNVRGEVVTVLDFANALDLPAHPKPAEAFVLLVEVPDGRVGLLVDTVLGVERLSLGRLDATFSGRDFARGVAGAQLVFLDLRVLLAGERFEVFEEVT